MQPKPWTAALLLAGLILETPIAAQTAAVIREPQAPIKPLHGPPPEAYLACEGKAAGEAVVIETPHGDEIEAICRYLGDRLAAKPINGPPLRPRDVQEATGEN